MPRLLRCELAKLKRKPLFFLASAVSALIPLAYALFLSDADNSLDAVQNMMASLFQLSAYMLLMPVAVVFAANLFFEEQDSGVIKNLLCVPVSKSALALSKMAVLLGFSVLFMAAGGLLCLIIILIQGWEPVGFIKLFFVGLGEGVLMWAGALPCILIVVLINRSYIISVIIAFFYTTANYILSTNELFLTQPFGLNPGTLLPGPLSWRWIFQFYEYSRISDETAQMLERVSPYFVSTPQAFLVAAAESAVFLFLIALVYRRQKS